MNILIKLINDVKALCNTIITAVNAIKAKTDTITADLFTATHASILDANISSRQASWGATSTHSSRIDANISSRQASWGATATHASRIDASISSRATNDGVWMSSNKLLSVATPSNNPVIFIDTLQTYATSGTPRTIILHNVPSGKAKITFEDRYTSTSLTWSSRENSFLAKNGVRLIGIATTRAYTNWQSYSVITTIQPGDVFTIELWQSNSSCNYQIQNFRICYDRVDNLSATTI